MHKIPRLYELGFLDSFSRGVIKMVIIGCNSGTLANTLQSKKVLIMMELLEDVICKVLGRRF
jgi:hypothetical protein